MVLQLLPCKRPERSDDMKSIMGLFDASLGAKATRPAGVAILARQREGDVSTFNFIDNLSRDPACRPRDG